MYVFLITFACFLLRSRLSVSLNMQAAARSDSCCKNHGICIPRFSNHCKNNGICTPTFQIIVKTMRFACLASQNIAKTTVFASSTFKSL